MLGKGIAMPDEGVDSLFGSFDLKRDGVSARATWTRQSHRLLALLTLNHNRAVKRVQ